MLQQRSVVAEGVCRDQTWTVGTHSVSLRRCRALQAFQPTVACRTSSSSSSSSSSRIVRVCSHGRSSSMLQPHRQQQAWGTSCRSHSVVVKAAGAATRGPAANSDFRNKPANQVNVLIVGPTGYIGKFVTKELIARGFNVTTFAREKAGIKGKMGKEDTQREFAGANVVFGDVTDLDSLRRTAFSGPVDVVVSCLASRTGGKKDSWMVDYQATKNVLDVAREQGASHFVLLSAICVQKPLLEFQRAKLKLEADLQAAGDITYSIVRPTAFFKSLAGQIELVKQGKPYVMFGDGNLASCKPISERDLAKFMADCITEEDKINQVLPIGGPGKALSAKDQADILFRMTGLPPKYFPVPIALMDGIIGIFDLLAKVFPGLEDSAEFGRIGRYYAAESMLVWDEKRQAYDAEATPSYGTDTLEAFFAKALKEGLKGQELGDQAVFGVGE